MGIIFNFPSLMKKSLLALILSLFILLFLFGCKSSEPEKTTAPSETNSDYFSTLQSLVEADEPFVYLTDFGINNLPRDLYSGQFYTKTAIQVGSLLFAFIEQPNRNIPVMLAIPENAEVKWAGILVSDDNGDTWKKFFTAEDRVNDQVLAACLKVNVVGFFTQNNTLFVDVSDACGAGSGEGSLIRYQSTDGGKKWTEEGCYYFIPDFGYYIYDSGEDNHYTGINPHVLESSDTCE